jgi:hypothetical protein
MEARFSSKTLVLTRTTRHHHMPDDTILHCYHHENDQILQI